MSATLAGLADLAEGLARRDVDVVRGERGAPWRALPADAAAVARIVQAARELRRAAGGGGPRLVPLGGGTRVAAARPDLELESAVPRCFEDSLFVDLARLRGIVEYEPGDGTLTARAGTPWHELAEAVAHGGHELTPDVPPFGTAEGLGSGRSTLGGILGAGASGPDRLQRGPVRHHVLGALVATGSGTLARSGGRLVKNVTGFDVFRLHVGGRGTLGIVCEASLRLVPLAEHEALATLPGLELGHALELAERVRRGRHRPRAIVVTNVLRDGCTLAVHLAGRAQQVEDDARALLETLGAGAELQRGEAARRGAAELRDTRARHGVRARPATDLALVVTSVPSAAVAVGRESLAWCREHGATPEVVVWPAVARFELALASPLGSMLGSPLGSAEGATALGDLARRLRALAATVQFAGGAPEAARDLARVAATAPRGGAPWERALAAALDPDALFAPRTLAPPTTRGGEA